MTTSTVGYPVTFKAGVDDRRRATTDPVGRLTAAQSRIAGDADLGVDGTRLVGHVGPRPRARQRPVLARSRAIPSWTPSSAQIVAIATASRSGSRGSTRRPAGPTISGSGPTADATTGVPAASASMTGRPAASRQDGQDRRPRAADQPGEVARPASAGA